MAHSVRFLVEMVISIMLNYQMVYIYYIYAIYMYIYILEIPRVMVLTGTFTSNNLELTIRNADIPSPKKV